MVHFRNWQDLEKLGINYLTGESCGLSMRLLCDVNETGRKSVESFFRCQLVEGSNWNSTVNGQPAVASVMLSRDMFESIAAFCHVEQTGYPARLMDNGEVIGMEGNDSAEIFDRVQSCRDGRWIGRTKHPGTGIDNTHAMTGRTV